MHASLERPIYNKSKNYVVIIFIKVSFYKYFFSNFTFSSSYRVVTNYVLWKVVQEHISNLSKPFRDVHDNYQNSTGNVSSTTPRWRTCLETVDKVMQYYVLGRIYVDKQFNDDDTKIVSILSTFLKSRKSGSLLQGGGFYSLRVHLGS